MRNFVLFISLFFTQQLVGKDLPLKKTLINLVEVQGTQEKSESVVTAIFSKELPYTDVKVEDHGSFIQILLPDTIATQAGEFFDGNSSEVKKIATFQRSSDISAIRLFVKNKAHLVKDSLDVTVMGNRLIATIDEKELLAKVEQDKTNEAALLAKETKLEKIIAETEVSKNIEEPAALVQGTTATSLAKSDLLSGKLSIIAAFFAGLLLIMVITLAFRSKIKALFRKQTREEREKKLISILDSQKLNNKQSLQVVSIEGQKIVLAVSDDSVSFMTNLTPAPVLARANAPQPAMAPAPARVSQPRQLTSQVAAKPTPRRASANIQASVKPAQQKPQIDTIDAPKATTTKKSINVAITDTGVNDLDSEVKNVDDVTRMIREKLKQFSSQM